MAITFLKVKLSNPRGKKSGVFEFLVDSGAVYSVVPENVLKDLGIKATSSEEFILADGEVVTKPVGNAYFEYGGKVRAAPVVFGENGIFLLGATSLEALGMILDPIRRQLKPLPMLLMHVAKMKRLYGLVLTLALAHIASAADWYVATNGTGDGTSWPNATNSIQGAIVASSAADTVWVSNGVYEAGGVTNYPAGTVLTNRVAIYKAITVQAFSTNPADTVIKGRWDDGYPGGPTTNKYGPAAVRCVYMINGSTLIGFTLTNGATLATGVANDKYGGGVWCPSANTVISNCVLTGNSAASYGGGAFYGTLFNCTLSGNAAVSYGGGASYYAILSYCILTSNSAYYGGGAYYGTLTDCTLRYNSATYGGGAWDATLNNCMIVSNSTGSTGQGGGVYNGTLTDCTLIGNVAQWGGGAVSATLTNCTLSGNAASFANGGGGGVSGGTLYNCILTNNTVSSANGGGGARSATLYNCTLVNNYCPYNGGGAKYGALYNCLLIGNKSNYGGTTDGGGAKDSTLYNCTVVGNESYYPAGLAGYGGGVSGGRLINCIVYSNYAKIGSNWYEVVAFTNTCTAPAATNGVGNITDNPLFIDPGSGYGSGHVAGNYRLRGNSPCVNTGTNFSWMTDPNDVRSKDLDVRPRIRGGQVDMGCYEYLFGGTMFTIQ